MVCYGSRPAQRVASQAVSIVDAVGTVQGTAADLSWLCRPTNLNGTDPAAPTAFVGLDGYRLQARPRHNARQTVRDAFGVHTFSISRASRLLVPAAHTLGSGPAFVSPTLDPFACYDVYQVDRASRRGPRQTVTLEDLFGTSNPSVGRPTRLCLPADVNGTAPQAPTHPDALLCYRLDPARRVRTDPVTAVDDFGTTTVVPQSRQELCVPAARE
jgi:hypothetical protein